MPAFFSSPRGLLHSYNLFGRLKSRRAWLRHSSQPFCSASMMQEIGDSIAVVWLRHDLRIADHEPLVQACSSDPEYLLPLFCLDTAELQPRPGHPELRGIPVLGPHRCSFLLEALQCLQSRLSERGSGLHSVLGRPEEEIPALLSVLAASGSALHVYHHRGIGSQAVNEEEAVKSACQAAADELGMACHFHAFWGHTMYQPEDVLDGLAKERRSRAGPKSQPAAKETGFAAVPGVMTNFRKAMEKHGKVREPLPEPSAFPPYPSRLLSQTRIPASFAELYTAAGARSSLAALEALTGCSALSGSERDPRTAFPFKGGEVAGRERLHHFLNGAEAGPERTNGRSGTSCEDHSHVDRSASCPADATRQPDGESAALIHGFKDSSTVESPLQPDQESAAPIHSFKDSRMMASGIDNSAKLSAYFALGCLSPCMAYWEVMTALQRHGTDTGHSCLIMHLTIRDFFLYTALKEGDRLERSQGLSDSAREWRFNADDFERWCKGRTGIPFVDACMRELAATGYMSNRGRQNVANFLSKSMGHDWRLGAAVFETLLVDHDWAVNTCNWAYNAGVGNDPRDRIFRTVSQGMMYDPEAKLIRAWIPELQLLSDEDAHQPWALATNDAARQRYPLPLLEPSTQIAVNYGKRT